MVQNKIYSNTEITMKKVEDILIKRAKFLLTAVFSIQQFYISLVIQHVSMSIIMEIQR